jgi:hypothetical protein
VKKRLEGAKAEIAQTRKRKFKGRPAGVPTTLVITSNRPEDEIRKVRSAVASVRADTARRLRRGLARKGGRVEDRLRTEKKEKGLAGDEEADDAGWGSEGGSPRPAASPSPTPPGAPSEGLKKAKETRPASESAGEDQDAGAEEAERDVKDKQGFLGKPGGAPGQAVEIVFTLSLPEYRALKLKLADMELNVLAEPSNLLLALLKNLKKAKAKTDAPAGAGRYRAEGAKDEAGREREPEASVARGRPAPGEERKIQVRIRIKRPDHAAAPTPAPEDPGKTGKEEEEGRK